ncbi:MAG: hypothetical protein ACT4OO_13930 [Nitrospiraceae bacterium]
MPRAQTVLGLPVGMRNGRKRILVLYWHPDPKELRVAVHRHLHVMDWSRYHHQILYYNTIHGAPSWLRHCQFDAVILHTTLLCLRWSHLFCEWKRKLRWVADLDSVKLAIPQDEYDHAWVLDEWLYELNVSIVFSNFDEMHRKMFYPIMLQRASFHKCLTGYVDDGDVERMRADLKPHQERTWDLVYRASHLPYWFGSQGQLKHRIADAVAQEATRQGIRCNISTAIEDTILGPQWLDFLASGRAVIGCESGSSVLDRRGEVRAKVQALFGSKPYLSFGEVSQAMPPGWDDYQFLAISPRHFEAILTKTCQILVEGHYNGILEPGRHYISLKRDCSNLSNVFDQLRDRRAVEAMAESAYEEVCGQERYSYKRVAADIDEAIEEQLASRVIAYHVSEPTRSRLPWRVIRAVGKLSEQARVLYYRLTRQLVQSSAHWWVLRHPVVCLAKAIVTVNLILGSTLTRDMLIHFLSTRTLRDHVSAYRLLGDLLAFRLLQEVQVGTLSIEPEVHVDVSYDRASEALVFITRSGVGSVQLHREDRVNALSDIERPQWVVWDHSAIGRQVLYPFIASKRLAFQIGPYGTHTFETLSTLVRSLPESLWERFYRSLPAGVLGR